MFKVSDEAREEEYETVDPIQQQLVDMMKVKFNDRFKNYVFSTCPVIPRFHMAFGEPLERQEVSAEIEKSKLSDNKKEEGKKLMGRVDNIYFCEKNDLFMVRDDFQAHLMYDAAIMDLQSLEEEALKICSFYIAK